MKGKIQFVFLIGWLLMSSQLLSQHKIMWNFTYNSIDQQLEFKASLQKGWHIYSQLLDENAGPIATTFELEKNSNLVLDGSVHEPSGEEVYDKNFGSMITYFSDEVTFIQPIAQVNSPTTVKGSVLFMICDDQGCLPPDLIEFEIPVK